MLSSRRVCTACSPDLFRALARCSFSLVRSPALRSLQSRLGVPRVLRSHSWLSRVSLLALGSQNGRHVGSCHSQRFFSSPSSDHAPSKKAAVFALLDRIHAHHYDLLEDVHDLGMLIRFPELGHLFELRLTDEFVDILGHLNQETLGERVRLARQQYGNSLPEGELNEEEMTLYTRLYGEPATLSESEPQPPEEAGNTLFRQNSEGEFVEVDLESELVDPTGEENAQPSDIFPVDSPEELERRMYEVAKQLEGDVITEFPPNDYSYGNAQPRAHPLTAAAEFRTYPSTVYMPTDTFTKPIRDLLSHHSPKHISEAAHNLFMPCLSKSTTTTKRTPQEPITSSPSQRIMSGIEASLFLAVLYPGMYATTLSILTEVRKRLGTKWLRDLIYKEGGPTVLDAGAGGAGILAWRDILKAEWSLMYPDHPSESQAPQGKATVVVGSDSLRHRTSKLLDNTTFIPRLPDYLHLRDKSVIDTDALPPKRKQFDVIIAPHTLMHFQEPYMRKEYVLNLWSLLNPNGGILVLAEKGIQRGFDVIGGAREMILERLIASPGSTQYENVLESPGDEAIVQKEKGMIVAPCTNHSKCPMYVGPDVHVPKRDYCHFSQRYIRPDFLQKISGAIGKNHEDVEFSYLVVQRGVDQRENQGIIQGPSAADAAFSGYEASVDNAGHFEIQELSEMNESTTPQVNTLSLPRLILPPIKRKGHVVMDVCTPAGKIERWVVPRSFSKQAYRDARKSKWGDLWALGAKTRMTRALKLGTAKKSVIKTKKEASKSKNNKDDVDDELGIMDEDGFDIPDFERIMEKFNERGAKGGKNKRISEDQDNARDMKPKRRPSDVTVPTWIKKMEKRRARKLREKYSKSFSET
ncbi:37S ribosomal protein Rsm22 [Coccidioides immitis RS]|uniref:37S ribosomal protein Rsm22 n=1 Tax=Coccidioides immitis (strain RS) TaxID=246410 RepID=J3KK24_COCIM|nr:37S ribosomal protein Rsm22 [Coccidioides immitis RS]EAS36490.3 37S ribosomal protein Rsm22 [Coccidioides immitis RS]